MSEPSLGHPRPARRRAPVPRPRWIALSLLAAASLGGGPAAASPDGEGTVGSHLEAPWSGDGIPDGPWRQYATPEAAGFSAAGLAAARAFADSVRSAAVMALHGSHVVAAWGDVTRELKAHSVRKSFVSALYGTAVADGAVELDATLAELGVDDLDGLTEAEKEARIRDLISARSGVYHPAAYAPESQEAGRPARGSHPPGTHWYYNNWDFNVAGVLFERLTGTDLYRAFERRIARPLGMEDWDPSDGLAVLEPTKSRHPAHTFRISARDMARFGLLYLREGRWGERRVLPAGWVRESTAPHSDLGDGRGYGYMWWTYAAGSLPERYREANRHDAYLARGTGGQAIFVIPDADMVVVHRGDTDHDRGVDGSDVWWIVELLLRAKEDDPAEDPDLVALSPVPLESQLPPAELPEPIPLERVPVGESLGRYEFGPGVVGRVFLHEGRPFISVPGEGEGELVPVSPSEFWIPAAPGVTTVRVRRNAEGAVTGLVVSLPDQTAEGTKLP